MTWTAYPYLATWPEEERVSFVSFSWKRNLKEIDIETTNHRLPIRIFLATHLFFLLELEEDKWNLWLELYSLDLTITIGVFEIGALSHSIRIGRDEIEKKEDQRFHWI